VLGASLDFEVDVAVASFPDQVILGAVGHAAEDEGAGVKPDVLCVLLALHLNFHEIVDAFDVSFSHIESPSAGDQVAFSSPTTSFNQVLRAFMASSTSSSTM